MSQPEISTPICQEDGCEREAKVRGLCQTHYQRLWRSENLERDRENQRKWREGNAEELRKKNQQRYLANRDKILERTREHQKSPEYRAKKAAAAKAWAQKHPDRVRTNRRSYWARTKYGLTLEEYDAILERGCAICGTHDGRVVGPRGEIPGSPSARLCIDHDHVNGKVRDALCHSCNTGLGSFGDDPARLKAAAKYLEKHRKGDQ